MFKFIRRISGSFLPRNDRPWSDDATSSAPCIGRKRVRSIQEEDERDAQAARKRTRGDEFMASPTEGDMSFASLDEPVLTVSAEADVARNASPAPGAPKDDEAEKEVKAVTQGVQEVDLEDKGASAVPEAAPEGAAEEVKEVAPKNDEAVEDVKEEAPCQEVEEKVSDDALPAPLPPPQKVDDVIVGDAVEADPAPEGAHTTHEAPAATSTPDPTSIPLPDDTPTKSSVPKSNGVEAVPSSRSPSPVPVVTA